MICRTNIEELINYQMNNQLWDRLIPQIRNQIPRTIRNQVKDRLIHQIRNQISDQVQNKIKQYNE